jgi:hypothetical protein
MINEANEPSSACRLWRIYQVETSTPPSAEREHSRPSKVLGQAAQMSFRSKFTSENAGQIPHASQSKTKASPRRNAAQRRDNFL